MPRNQKDPQERELDEEEHDVGNAPRVDESEVEDDERALQSLDKRDKHEEVYELDEDDIVEEIDIEDLPAMEGPDRT